MVSLLDERDRLLETMRSLQEQVALGAQRAAQLEKERDLLAEHINATMPHVRHLIVCVKYERISMRTNMYSHFNFSPNH